MITVRQAQLHDAEAILRVRRELIEEETFFISTVDEFRVTKEEQEKSLEQTKKQGGVTLVAEADGEVIGFLSFKRSPMKRLSHAGFFGMGLTKSIRNQGAGKMLIHEMQQWGSKQEGLEKICLGVLSSNERAVHVYQKMGFVEEGRERNFLKFADGSYADNRLMAFFL